MDSSASSTFVIPNHPITQVFRDSKRKGIRLRFIADITKDNIGYCKELLDISELRHLDEVKGNFGIVDRMYYRATAISGESGPPPSLISSSIRVLVQQQQYFFDTLWRKAIPANQRIREIEENLKRKFIETIQDSEETATLISKVLLSATEEIQLIFSRANSLKKYEKLGLLDIVRKKANEVVEVRVLIGTGRSISEMDVEVLKEYPSIELRYLSKSIQSSLTTIVTDRELSLVIEEKEGKDDVDIGFTTYSNSESTVQSYASLFENLWAQSTKEGPKY
jgi:hypothetical protein